MEAEGPAIVSVACIRDVPGSIFGYSGTFHGFSQSFQTDARILPWDRPSLHSSKCFITYYHLHISFQTK